MYTIYAALSHQPSVLINERLLNSPLICCVQHTPALCRAPLIAVTNHSRVRYLPSPNVKNGPPPPPPPPRPRSTMYTRVAATGQMPVCSAQKYRYPFAERVGFGRLDTHLQLLGRRLAVHSHILLLQVCRGLKAPVAGDYHLPSAQKNQRSTLW